MNLWNSVFPALLVFFFVKYDVFFFFLLYITFFVCLGLLYLYAVFVFLNNKRKPNRKSNRVLKD